MADSRDEEFSRRDVMRTAGALSAVLAAGQAPLAFAAQKAQTYERGEIANAVGDFFGVTAQAAAQVVERIFSDLGRPDAYIAGEEASGAIGVGLRYGEGYLYMKQRRPAKIYWQGPSIGFDIGGNASKCFTLGYNIQNPERIFRRFGGVEGSYYFIAGIGVNYQRDNNMTLAPMRTGAGLRAGVNVGYLKYTEESDWFPL